MLYAMHIRAAIVSILAATLVVLPLPPAAAAPPYLWPMSPRPVVENPFDPPEHDWLPGHRGVDLAGWEGRTVLSAGEGTVVFAGTVAGKPVVSIDHPGGLRTTYEPVLAAVRSGNRVRAGDPIGTLRSGHQGCSAVCLHWGLRRGREYLDPTALLRLTPIRLKPLGRN